MRNTRKNRRVLAVIVCALVTLAIGGIAAWAVMGDGWIDSSSETGANTLTVVASENDEAYADDLNSADVVVDVYQVASAEGTIGYDSFKYTLEGAYTGLQDMLNDALKGGTTYTWQDLANEAAKLADLRESGSLALGDSITLDDGLYLVLAHGRGVTDATVANSASYAYTFNPVIVALPTKTVDETVGVPNTAYGEAEYAHTVELQLKSSRELRFGDIRITKNTVVSESDSTPAPVEEKPVTFTFHIYGTTPAGDAYDNYASVTLQPGESEGSVVVKHIPAGTELTVDEVYTGGDRYAQVGTITVGEAGSTVIANDTIDFYATNRPDGGIPDGGNGVQNNFEYTKTDPDNDASWDWPWTPSPQVPSVPSAN